MYQILCDGFVLSDPRDEALSVKDKKCKIGSNICGEASFSIYANHPHYGKLKKLRSVFEIKQDNDTIFRGRMTDDTRDFDNMKAVDLEGAMAYLNDSVIRPFAFPGDFKENMEYIEAANSGNVVRFLLKWLLDSHNAQVEPFQQLKLGKVTVSDKNNYISRENKDYSKTWQVVKTALFESSLGGYLCIRYEDDGNYIDYLYDFVDDDGNQIVNGQSIDFHENLLDYKSSSDATETYTAIIPIGAEVEVKSEDGTATTKTITIEELPDGSIDSDIVKDGDTIYSISGVAAYGWIYAPVSDTTWEDVTEPENLRSKAVDHLKNKAMGFLETTTFTALDLHLADSSIESFRIYKYVNANSAQHGLNGNFPLSELDLDMDNLQNTKITVGETKKTLINKTNQTANKVDQIQKNYATNEVLSNEIKRTWTLIEQTEYNINLEVGTVKDDLEKVNAKLELAIVVDEDGVVQSVLGASADTIQFNSNTLVINSDNLTLTAEGTLASKNGVFENCSVKDGVFEDCSVSGSFQNTGTYGLFEAKDGCVYISTSISDNNMTSMLVPHYLRFANTNGVFVISLDQSSGDATMHGTDLTITGGVTTIQKTGTRYDYRTRFSDGYFQSFQYSFVEYASMWVTSDDAFQLKTANSKNFQIYGDGTNNRLQGSWYTSDNIAVSSDANLKNSITDVSDSYGIFFDNLRPVNYKYNEGRSQRIHAGFIAQEVDEALQKAGLTRQDFAGLCIADEGTDKEYWGLRYSEFVSLNTHEIQKLKKEVAEIKAKIGD